MKAIIMLIGLSLFISAGLMASDKLDMRKKIESKSHNNRIGILQEADRCIAKATTNEEYKRCEQVEKKARQENKKDIKSMKDSERVKLFAQKKTEILSRIDQRRMKNEKVRTCVINSSNFKEMKECRPKREKRRKNK